MITDHEAIQAELFARLQQIPGVVTTSRILSHWADVPAEHQPALYLTYVSYTPSYQGRGIPPRWDGLCNVTVYAQRDPVTGTCPQLLPLVESVINAFAPSGISNTCALAGAIDVRIESPIVTDEGLLGNQALAVIPLTIFTA